MTTSGLTYAGVLLAVFANQACLPIPSSLFLMTAGALAAHGRMHPAIIVFLGVSGCLAADGMWFWFGRKWGSRAMRVLCRFSADPRTCSQSARDQFRRHGLPVICVAKFLPGLDAVTPPLAGAEGVSVPAFISLDFIGSFLWSSAYVGLGHLFSNQLDVAIVWVTHFGTALGAAIGVPIFAYVAWRAMTLIHTIRQLRLRRIGAPMLARKLKSKSKVAVLDLSEFEDESETPIAAAIPGALRVHPAILRKTPHILVPDDVEIVIYSSSGRDTTSARAAVGLKRIGVENVWVLEGGLKAWREQGYAVAQSLEPPEVVARRFGVSLPKPPSVQVAPVHPGRQLPSPLVNEC